MNRSATSAVPVRVAMEYQMSSRSASASRATRCAFSPYRGLREQCVVALVL